MNFERGERIVYFRQVHPCGKIDAIFLSRGKMRSRIKIVDNGQEKIIMVGNESIEKWKPVRDPVLLRPLAINNCFGKNV